MGFADERIEDGPWGQPIEKAEEYVARKWGVTVEEAEQTVARVWKIAVKPPTPTDTELMRACLVLATWAMYRLHLDWVQKEKER